MPIKALLLKRQQAARLYSTS